MSGPRAANLGLRFLVEIAALAALAFWGFHTGTTVLGDAVLGIGTPLVAAVVWGRFAAPRSEHRLHGAALTAVQVTVFAAAAIALIAADEPVPAAIFAGVAVINAALIEVWHQS
jgi:Protein of unknown function (DUF2568)